MEYKISTAEAFKQISILNLICVLIGGIITTIIISIMGKMPWSYFLTSIINLIIVGAITSLIFTAFDFIIGIDRGVRKGRGFDQLQRLAINLIHIYLGVKFALFTNAQMGKYVWEWDATQFQIF